ncbi:S8 family peptidase [Streptomyces sp. NPDC003691]
MRRRRTLGTAGALALALVAGTAAPAAGASPAAGAPPGATGTPPAPGTAKGAAGQTPPTAGLHTVTLLTGDRVLLGAADRVLRVDPAKGRERIPVRVGRHAGRTFVVPLDAERLISAGKLDRDLFDVTGLGRPEARKAYRDGLRVIVVYGGSAAGAARKGVRAAGTAGRSLPSLNAEALTASPADPGALWRALTAGPGDGARATAATTGVAKIWLDGVTRAALDGTTRQIGAPAAWDRSYDGTGVTIAVLDTGIDDTHPDLAGKVRAAADFTGMPGGTGDRHGHGTHVASTAAGTGAKDPRFKGVAPGAALLNGKVLNDYGWGFQSGILAGIEWAAAQGADIVNMSLGGPDRPGTGPTETLINRLSEQKGILFAVAAGNYGPDERSVDSPGSAEAALTVGAVDDNDTVADFSARGPRLGDQGIKPDVTAPGVGVTAAAAAGVPGQNPPGYLGLSGTSMATPHAAGAAALLKQQHPDWTGARLKAALMSSAKPGTGSPYVQGAGRIAVDRAVTGSVFAETGSLSLGTQPWPHDDDTPAVRKLTYRNAGAEDITLDLALTGATGPGGTPAPDGFFTLGAPRITVPAGGTAGVDITADTRIAAGGDGGYTAVVTASAGGTGLARTPVVVDREAESYSLTVRALARDGKPDPYAFVGIAGLTGAAAYQTFEADWSSGTATLRLPKGRYFLDHYTSVGGDETKGIDQVLYPRLEMDRDRTVVLDARKARASRITVPDPRAKPNGAITAWGLEPSGYSMAFRTESPADLRTAHAGPAAAPGDRPWQGWMGMWQGGAGDLAVAHYRSPARFAPLTRHFRPGEFSPVTLGLGASAPGKTSMAIVVSELPGDYGNGLGTTRNTPSRYSFQVAGSDPVRWSFVHEQLGAGNAAEPESYHVTSRHEPIHPGKAYRFALNTGVHGPRIIRDLGVYRDGESLWGMLPFYTDGGGHIGDAPYTTARTTLHRDGKPVDEKADDLISDEALTMPAVPGRYTLASTVTRPAGITRVATRVEGRWTFDAAHAPSGARLPLSVVRFAPAVALDSTAPAGRFQTFPVTVEGSGAGGNLKALAVQVSYDGGKTWRKVPVKQGKVTIANPAKGKGLALRGRVTDRQGNLSVITVHQAYLGR